MREGWIKTHRQFLYWEWFTEENMFHVFHYLLLCASFKKTKYKGVHLKPGQFLCGLPRIVRETGISEQKVKTCVKRLELTNEITREPRRHGTVYTIVNWDKYQGSPYDATSELTSELTGNYPATNRQLTTIKNVKNVNKEIIEEAAAAAAKTQIEEKSSAVPNGTKSSFWIKENLSLKDQELIQWLRNVTIASLKKWKETYPQESLQTELFRAWEYDIGRPKAKQAKNIGSFVSNWLRRSEELKLIMQEIEDEKAADAAIARIRELHAARRIQESNANNNSNGDEAKPQANHPIEKRVPVLDASQWFPKRENSRVDGP